MVRIFGKKLLFHPDDGVGCLALLIVKAGHLVVDSPEGLVKALVVRVRLLGIAQVQLAVKSGSIAGLGKYFGHGDVLGRKSCVLNGKADFPGARADGKLSCRHSGSARRAAGLGVHTSK